MTKVATEDGGQRTSASRIVAELRAEILRGALQPGTRLKIGELQARFQTAINPIREGLNRLVSEGLVELVDHKGFSVSEISLDAWRDILEARCMIEAVALERSIRNPTDEWRDEIVVSLHRLVRTPRFVDVDTRLANEDWEQVHHRFHRALIANCGSGAVMSICDDLRRKADRYRALAGKSQKARTNYNEEHERMANHALNGEVEPAVTTLVAHYRATISVVERYFEDSSGS
jgi:GntR family carbon starvation induced transcriptional regulator